MSALPEERQETALERAQRRRDEALARPIVIRCQDCLWEQEGPVLEARRAWAEHRRDEHDDPSGMESVERIAKPLTMREIKHGGRKRKHEPTRKEPDVQIRICKREDCDERALDHRGRYAGLCAEHKREAREQQAARQTGQPRGQLAAVPPPGARTGAGRARRSTGCRQERARLGSLTGRTGRTCRHVGDKAAGHAR